MSISKILAAGLKLNLLPLGYTSSTHYEYFLPHYEFIIFWLHSHFSKIIKPETKPYLYPDICPDNLVSGKRGWLGFNGILSTQVAAISCLKKLKVC